MRKAGFLVLLFEYEKQISEFFKIKFQNFCEINSIKNDFKAASKRNPKKSRSSKPLATSNFKISLLEFLRDLRRKAQLVAVEVGVDARSV